MPIPLTHLLPFIRQAPPVGAGYGPLQQLAADMHARSRQEQQQRQFDSSLAFNRQELSALNQRHGADLQQRQQQFDATQFAARRQSALEELKAVIGAAMSGNRAGVDASAPVLAAHGVEMTNERMPVAPVLPGQEPKVAMPAATLDAPGLRITPSSTPEPQVATAPTGRYGFSGDILGGPVPGIDLDRIEATQRQAVQPSLDAMVAAAAPMDQPFYRQQAKAVLASPQAIAQGAPKVLESVNKGAETPLSQAHEDKRAESLRVTQSQRQSTSNDFRQNQQDRIARDGWVTRARTDGKLALVLEMGYEAKHGLDMLASAAKDNSPLEERVALANLTRSMFGKAQSNQERNYIMGAGGQWNTFDQWLNNWSLGNEAGRMTEQTRKMLHGVLQRGMANARNRQLQIADTAANAIRGEVLISEGNREALAANARSYILGESYTPPAGVGAPATAPAQQSTSASASVSATGPTVDEVLGTTDQLLQEGWK